MAAGVKSLSKTFVWIILALLIVGLAGFGATNLSGTIRTIGYAGDQPISVDDYGRELQREIRAIEAQSGQTLPMSQVRAMGLDQIVLSRLVGLASLDNEVASLGISIGDANLQQEILQIPAFQGIDGAFDRESYRFALSQAGLNETDFENDLRAESARTIVQGAIMAGTTMPAIMTNTMTDHIAARRNFIWAQMTAENLDTPIADPTPDQLQAYYDEHPDDFTLPETKRLTYVLMTPEMILDQVKIDETALRDLYDSRSEEYDVAERRLVERLAFSDISAASSAKAQLDVGGTTFDALVEQRGLALSDIDMGDVTREDLREAADDIFAADIGDVLGPLPSELGPALYRVNGNLAARVTAFEDVEEELRAELAGDRARRLIETQAEGISDLMAGGATLEELVEETDLELGTINWTDEAHEGVAAYEDFRAAAAAVTADDFPEIGFTEDGAIFALRLEEVLPVRPEPFAAAREKVAQAWTLDQTEAALKAQAETIVAELGETGDFTETGLSFRVENSMTRSAYIESTPTDFMSQVFELEKGELRVIASEGTVLIVRLEDTLPPENTAELTAMQTAFGEGLDQALAENLFEVFMRDARQRAKPQIDQQALNAVQASFQ
ncbi:peptidylprolyl isomerase [Sedimentitalea todarodis]|uniref:SurA N-terminal domain-containing protein n=1 Tax=Sedimentitalea todarodis TaxID=1631240 RepID=A0ABU3VC43_9RHOB|nr:peptidyl-prolyl cis-trans isomerase [Sedimentitalea todarodis]MDU9003758.1 SurA N-terminal domain-containing protein [Sedimentitalea todarodis]